MAVNRPKIHFESVEELLGAPVVKDGTEFVKIKDIHSFKEHPFKVDINKDLIDFYNLDLEIFYNEVPKIDSIIEEIPMDKIHIIVDKMGIVIANSKETKSFVIDMPSIKQFIKVSTELILANLNELNIFSIMTEVFLKALYKNNSFIKDSQVDIFAGYSEGKK